MNILSSLPLTDPIQILHAEHTQIRAICDRLDRLADDLHHGEVIKDAGLIVKHLTQGLPLHFAYELEDFYPLLLSRCRPEDAADEIVTLLGLEHRKTEKLIDALLGDLSRLAAGRLPEWPVEFVWRLRAFTECQRRHTAWTDATVLRLARLRLGLADRALLANRMTRRRAAHDAVPLIPPVFAGARAHALSA
jgi:hemerythrin-like domain-containing protein